MTVFWVNTLPALQALITGLALEDSDPLWLEQGAEWATQAHAFVSPDAALRINMRIATTGDGEYETRYVDEVDSGTGEITGQRAVFTGFRAFILEVRCEAYEQDFARWALVYAERIRTNLQRTSTIDRVQHDLGLSFFKYSPINDMPGVEDGHAISIAVFSLSGYVGFSDDPATAELVPMFTSIEIKSKVNDYPIGTPPNFIAEIPSDPV